MELLFSLLITMEKIIQFRLLYDKILIMYRKSASKILAKNPRVTYAGQVHFTVMSGTGRTELRVSFPGFSRQVYIQYYTIVLK